MSKTTPTCPYCGAYMVLGSTGVNRTRNCYVCVKCGVVSPHASTAEEARSAALHRASPWHSVKDGLPDTDRDVLVARLDKSGMSDIVVGYYNGKWVVYMGATEVTHWMELPDPPKEDDHA